GGNGTGGFAASELSPAAAAAARIDIPSAAATAELARTRFLRASSMGVSPYVSADRRHRAIAPLSSSHRAPNRVSLSAVARSPPMRLAWRGRKAISATL